MNIKQEKRYKEYLKQKSKRRPKQVKQKKKKKKKRRSYEELAKKCSEEQRKKANRLERKVKAVLEFSGVNYIWQQPFWNSTQFYVVDFYLPDHKIVIECDGSYHEEMKERDEERTMWLRCNMPVKEVVRIHYTQFFSNCKEETEENLLIYLNNL